MSLKMVVGEDFPRLFAMLDDTSPYADYSGYEVSVTCASTNRGVSLAKGSERSLIVSDTERVTIGSVPLFKQGKEYLPFTIAAFVRPVVSDPAFNQEIQILGNPGVMDGLTIKGTVVSFVTKFTNTGEARASFDIMDFQNIDIEGVHTKNKNTLYINGEPVAEVDLTDEQQADTYIAAGGTLSSGEGATSTKLMLNAIRAFDIALDEDSILTHYANAQDTLGAEDVAIDYHGGLLEFAPEGSLSPFYQVTFSSDEEWNFGGRNNVVLDDGTLYPASHDGVSQAGYWEAVLPLGIAPVQLYSANLLWEGTGATVSTSRDGIEWTSAQKGKALATVPKGTNGEGEFLYVRVSFPGGIPNDPSFFDDMTFSLYAFETAPTFGGREVVLDKVSLEDDTDAIDLHENWGAELQAGTLTIKAGNVESTPQPRTIEVWINKGNGALTDNLTGATVFSNGGPEKALAAGEWQLRHYVFDDPFTGDITFTGTGQIGHVILYPEKLSNSTIKEIHDSYTGKPRILLDVDEVFDIHEFSGQVDIYEYDWSIESSG